MPRDNEKGISEVERNECRCVQDKDEKGTKESARNIGYRVRFDL